MGIMQEVASGSAGGVGEVVKGAVALASVGTIAIKSVARVPKNHRGYPTVRENPERTWGSKKGQRYKPVGSGFHLVYPFVGAVESRSMQEQPDELPAFSVECTDGKYMADASIVWHVKQSSEIGALEAGETSRSLGYLPKREYLRTAAYGVSSRVWSWYFSESKNRLPTEIPQVSEDDEHLYNALFKVEKGKLDNYIRSLARAGIIASARTLTSEQLLEPNAALTATRELYGETLDEHGVALDSIFITSFAPSEAQVLMDGVKGLLGGDSPGASNVVEGVFRTFRAVGDE